MQVYGALSLSNQVTFFGLPDIPISDVHARVHRRARRAGHRQRPRPCARTRRRRSTANFLGHNGATATTTANATIDGCRRSRGPDKAKKCKKKAKRKKGKGASAAAKKKKKCKKRKRKKR